MLSILNVAMCDHQTLGEMRGALYGGINGEQRDRQSWQHRLSPSVRSARSPLSKISLGEREAKYIIANDASPRVAECWAPGERTGGGDMARTQEVRERGERVNEMDYEESSP